MTFNQSEGKKRYFFIFACLWAFLSCTRLETLQPGDAVWVQWTPEIWYHGRIEAACERGFKVRLDDQDEKCSPLTELAKDITPTRSKIQAQTNLLCRKGDGQYYPCLLLHRDGLHFKVRFSDQNEARLPLNDLRIPALDVAKK